MKTGDIALFPLEGAYLPGIEPEAAQDFRETAHDLDSTRDDGRYGVASGKEFVYLIRATTNDYAHTQSYDEVKSAIRPLAVAAARQKKFLAFAEEKAAALSAALTNGTAFADAAAAQSLTTSTSITFTVDGLAPNAFENARVLVPELVRLKAGAISKPIEVYNAALLAFVSDRKAGDAIAAESHREQLRSMLSANSGAVAFSDWLIWNLERTGFTSNRAASFAAANEASSDDEASSDEE
jgi:hypothetical protein